MFLGRYPASREINLVMLKLQTMNRLKSYDLFLFEFYSEIFEKNYLNVFIDIKTCDKKFIFDVTHTSQVDYNSGIQRLVRSMMKNLVNFKNHYLLVKYQWNDFKKLNNCEEENIYNWNNKKQVEINYNSSKIQKIKVLLKRNKVIYLTSLLAYRIIKSIVGKPKKASIENVEILYLENCHYFLPEINDNEKVYDLLSILSSHLNVKVSIVIYDLIGIYYPEYCAIRDFFIKYLTVLRTADNVICISKTVADELNEFVKPFRRLRPINITYQLLGSEIECNCIVNTTNQNDDIPFILYVSTIEPRKNQISVLFAFKKLSLDGIKAKLVFAGKIGWYNDDFMREYQECLKDGLLVDIIQGLSDMEISSLYKNAYFSIFCSFVEGFGLPIVESIALGTPCITSNIGSMKEIADNVGGCHLVDPYSFEDIYSGMKKLLTDTNYHSKLRDEAMNSKWITWKEYSEKIWNVINA